MTATELGVYYRRNNYRTDELMLEMFKVLFEWLFEV